MHAEQQGRLRPDRALVVGRARAVRRPDLDEPRARAGEDVGDAEAVADLDQLAARDDDLAALRERGEREQHGGGVVVDDERGLGAGQPPEELREVILARAALAALEVVLEVRVARADLDDARERGVRERRAPEIRVHENAGRVEHAAQRGPARAGELREDASTSAPGSPPAPISSRARSSTARAARDHELVRLGCEPLVAEQLVDGGQVAELHAESVGTSSRRSAVSEPAARAADLEHRLVVDLLRQDARGHVRDDGDAEHANAHVPRGDHLLHRRHPDEVAADGAHEPDLRRRLELRPEPRRVDALADARCRAAQPPPAPGRAAPGRTRRSCPGSAARASRRSARRAPTSPAG